MTETIRLTQFAKGAGCGCKIAPAVLEEILANNRSTITPTSNLLIGNNSNDDAAVYDLNNGMALLVTSDFFMPIVDDAFTFGRVAAANALSDVYAMAGKPITAIALLGWPIDKLSAALASEVMAGARAACAEAGIEISGGHTIDSAEPFFGLSVNGLVKIEEIKRNSTAKEGDLILMNKALGVGILSTAEKRAVIEETDQRTLHAQLIKLNNIGASFAAMPGVHALTDITGFGLMGHLIEMCEGSGLSAEIDFSRIPRLAACNKYMDQHIVPDASFRNWNAYSPKTEIAKGLSERDTFMLLPDPQTNGALLVALDPADEDHFIHHCKNLGEDFVVIGKMQKSGNKVLQVI